MSRPKQCRRIVSPPLMVGFKPFGVPKSMIEEVILKYDEYEVIRLLDYEGMLQGAGSRENECVASYFDSNL